MGWRVSEWGGTRPSRCPSRSVDQELERLRLELATRLGGPPAPQVPTPPSCQLRGGGQPGSWQAGWAGNVGVKEGEGVPPHSNHPPPCG